MEVSFLFSKRDVAVSRGTWVEMFISGFINSLLHKNPNDVFETSEALFVQIHNLQV